MKARLILVGMILGILFFSGCSREREPVAGSYQGEGGAGIVELELKPDGQGVWSSENDEIGFKWSLRNGEIWLHTKDGGVLVGQTQGEQLHFDLPGSGKLVFVRSEQ